MYFQKINNTDGNTSLILIFLGWGMDSTPFLHLKKVGSDIVLAWGIPDADTPRIYADLLSRYKTTAVIAWSYGVVSADSLISDRESLRIAVNGTVTPVDNLTGIPKHVFAITLRSISAENMRRFYSSAAGRSPLRGYFMSHLPERDVQSLKDDLAAYATLRSNSPNKMWDKVFIAANDAIIPPANQEKAWEGFMIKRTDDAHLPDFQRIIDTEIPDKTLIAKSFSRSKGSYEGSAYVQKKIAETLHSYWIRFQDVNNKDILEIGSGTGLMTKTYTDRVDLSRLTLVDIAPYEDIEATIRDIEGGDKIKVVSADAEEYMSALEDNMFDAVISSSTIQWFESPRRFFFNLNRVLRTGGVAAISTFVSGNYAEIADVAGRTLDYYTLSQYTAMLPETLKTELTVEDSDVCTFENGKSLLKHIKDTGVNALNSTPLSYSQMTELIKQLDMSPRLTYKYIYLIIRKL